jgi:hypothetical protein
MMMPGISRRKDFLGREGRPRAGAAVARGGGAGASPGGVARASAGGVAGPVAVRGVAPSSIVTV